MLTHTKAALAMNQHTTLPFAFPVVRTKKVSAAFDGGRLSSDGGVMLLALTERKLAIADKLAAAIAVGAIRPELFTRWRTFCARLAIACGYEDANDLDHLRTDPAFKIAGGRLPDSGADLYAQPTVSRGESADAAGEHPAESGDDRPLLRELYDAACCGHA